MKRHDKEEKQKKGLKTGVQTAYILPSVFEQNEFGSQDTAVENCADIVSASASKRRGTWPVYCASCCDDLVSRGSRHFRPLASPSRTCSALLAKSRPGHTHTEGDGKGILHLITSHISSHTGVNLNLSPAPPSSGRLVRSELLACLPPHLLSAASNDLDQAARMVY